MPFQLNRRLWPSWHTDMAGSRHILGFRLEHHLRYTTHYLPVPWSNQAHAKLWRNNGPKGHCRRATCPIIFIIDRGMAMHDRYWNAEFQVRFIAIEMRMFQLLLRSPYRRLHCFCLIQKENMHCELTQTLNSHLSKALWMKWRHSWTAACS